jgi:hypothetical protein
MVVRVLKRTEQCSLWFAFMYLAGYSLALFSCALLRLTRPRFMQGYHLN